MESLLHPELDYTNMPQTILAQKHELDRKISELSNANVLHPGLQHFEQEHFEPLQIDQIPGNGILKVNNWGWGGSEGYNADDHKHASASLK